MDTEPALIRTAAIIVAAGQGVRARQKLPKQFAPWQGKPLLRHSVETFVAAGCSPIIVAIPEGCAAVADNALHGIDGIRYVIGRPTRQGSVRVALEALEGSQSVNVMIHDAARPLVPSDVLTRLAKALDKYDGAIPVLGLVDSLSIEENGRMAGHADRNHLRRVQTPQAFRFAPILAAHRNWQGAPDAGDDAQVFHAAGEIVTHVEGDETLRKITVAEDFAVAEPQMRVGMGYDVHRLVAGEELWLGGIRIDHETGLQGHSDADVALHAIVDALLGAVAAGDIGQHFPPSEKRWKGAASSAFLEHAAELVGEAGYAIGNIDLTIICEAPKIGPHRDAIRIRIGELLRIDIGQVSVKATTTEGLGFTGKREGIAAQAIATVAKF